MRRGVLNRLGHAFVLATAVTACSGMLTAAQAAPAAAPVAQAAPTPTPAFRPPSGAAPTPAPTARPAATATTSTAPRAGGFPLELALPMLAGGAAALGAGVSLVRRGKK
jgi:hypothetical protein